MSYRLGSIQKLELKLERNFSEGFFASSHPKTDYLDPSKPSVYQNALALITSFDRIEHWLHPAHNASSQTEDLSYEVKKVFQLMIDQMSEAVITLQPLVLLHNIR